VTVLITGGMGFIGLNTIEAFLDAGADVVATYHQTWRVPSFLEPHVGHRLTFEQVDMSEPGALLAIARKHRVEDIVHMAIHGQANKDAGDDLRANLDKLAVLLDAARDAGVRRLSLSSIVSIVASGPFREDDLATIDTPIPPFAYKKAWEILALNYARLSGIEVVNMRLPGVYGPLYASMRNLPSRLCHAAARGIETDLSPAIGGVPFADDAADLAYVKDIARGVVLVQQAEKLEHHTYNIGSGRATSNAEFVAAVKKIKPSFDVELQPGKSPSFRQDAYADISRAGSELGYEPRYSWETGVAEYIDWLEQGNPQ
jgi:UDP-glucose 4-epimerase